MKSPIVINSDDSILDSLVFSPYRSKVVRRVVPFIPDLDEPQTLDVYTSWGVRLTAKQGDLLVSELDKPHEFWPVDASIFEESYVLVRPGYCVKKAITLLAPLTDLTRGDADQLVTVVSLEGAETVRAGDFYLAKGVRGEIWAYPKKKIRDAMVPAD